VAGLAEEQNLKLRFISLLVPTATIEQSYAGGLAQCLADFGPVDGDSLEIADGLLRISAMSPQDMQSLCDIMASKGLRGITATNGKQYWDEFCVVDTLMGLTLPCNWITVDRDTNIASLKTSRA
jgi:hypothetical protein